MVDNTKFRVFAEKSDNVYSDNDYANSNSTGTSSREYGNKTGTPVDSRLQNTALKTATLISKALLDAIVTNENLGLNSSITELKEAILNGLKNIEVNKAVEANYLGDYISNDFAKLNEDNNFSVQPKYNSKKLLIETDTINNAKNATNAEKATDATNATNYKEGSTNKNIANKFSSITGRVGVLEQTQQVISMDIQNIQSRLENLGFKEGSMSYRTSSDIAEESNLIRKQGKFAICNLSFGSAISFTLSDILVPSEFKPKQDTYIFIKLYQTNEYNIPVINTYSVKLNMDGSINERFENVTHCQILNSGWEIA